MDVYFSPAVGVRKDGSKEFRVNQRELHEQHEGLIGNWEHMSVHVHAHPHVHTQKVERGSHGMGSNDELST